MVINEKIDRYKYFSIGSLKDIFNENDKSLIKTRKFLVIKLYNKKIKFVEFKNNKTIEIHLIDVWVSSEKKIYLLDEKGHGHEPNLSEEIYIFEEQKDLENIIKNDNVIESKCVTNLYDIFNECGQSIKKVLNFLNTEISGKDVKFEYYKKNDKKEKNIKTLKIRSVLFRGEIIFVDYDDNIFCVDIQSEIEYKKTQIITKDDPLGEEDWNNFEK